MNSFYSREITYLLSRRYLRGIYHNSTLATMVITCFLGIYIGTLALTLVTSIMRGFEKVTYQKMQGIHASISMRAQGEQLNIEAIQQVFADEFPEITSSSPTAYEQVIARSNSATETTSVVLLKAIQPETERLVTSLETKILTNHGTPSLQEAVANGSLLIGKQLAQDLNLHTGDSLTLLYTDEPAGRKATVKFHQITAPIGALFATGIDEFDSNIAYCSFSFFEQLFPNEGATQLNIKLADVDENALIQRLRVRFSMDVFSWKELYPALVSALKLEKYVMALILALITLVASMNIVSLMFMHITQKRRDIALLLAMGTSFAQLYRLFLLVGMKIALCACTSGLLSALLLGMLIERYPCIQLPDVYYVSHLPIALEPSIFIAVFSTVMVLSFCATMLSVKSLKAISIAEVLRFEG